MFTADPMPRFPQCPTFGFRTSPDYLVKIIARESGFERRDLKWSQAIRTYTAVPVGPRPQADMEAVQAFYLAISGFFTIFRFKDWTDYQSCSIDATPAPDDQLLSIPAGSPSVYQLAKTYTAGALVLVRAITRPVGSSVMIANEAGEQQDASTWSLDESTGLVTPLSSFNGTPGSWGGSFEVPVRFDSVPEIEVVDFQIQHYYQPVVLKEDRAG
jgi:uncharacterized protein (TIGR02217 family)